MELRKKVLITMPKNYCELFIGKEGENQLSKFCGIRKNTTNQSFPEADISKHIKDVDGVIVGWGDNGLSEENLKAADKLKLIGVVGDSVKKVQPELALKKGITIINTAEVIGDFVAEHTLAFMLSWLRRITYYDVKMKSGYYAEKSWSDIDVTKNWDTGSFLKGKNIGIIGMGKVGKRLVELLQPFKVTIRVYSSHFPKSEAQQYNIELTSLEKTLKRSDIVSIHAGLRKETFHLIGERELNLMKEGALLVNTARGEIIDEKALISTLEKGRIYAALDVYSKEPLLKNSPLRKLDNVILTPHTAGPHLGGYDKEIRQQVGYSLVKDFQQFFFGGQLKNALSKKKINTMT